MSATPANYRLGVCALWGEWRPCRGRLGFRAVPTEKRQRQKEGRQKRLEAQRKVQRRNQLLRRSVIVVVIAAIVGYTAYKITAPGPGPNPIIAETQAANAQLAKIIVPQEDLTATQRSNAQARANAAAVAAGCPSSPTTRVNHLSWKTPPKMTISPSASYSAIVKTDVGSFTIALDAKSAPITVNNFVYLARHGFYNCVIFQRVIPSFMDQTGDPTGTGGGGPGYTIPDEYPAPAFNKLYQYPAGGVAMANESRPHTGGSQFFIVTGVSGEGLANTYTLFGKVTQGLDVVALINGQGNSATLPDGSTAPPFVIHRMLKVTIIGPSG
jgi:cyclophilin family peptidyl-prolyl cis-trans isomerase